MLAVLSALFFSCSSDDVLLSAPSLTTNPVTSFTVSTAQINASITSDGNDAILEKGVCWSTNPNPSIVDSYLLSQEVGNEFTIELSRLCTYTTYYVRAFATNRQGISYGDEMSFTTQAVQQVITIETDKLSYGLCEPIALTITNNSLKDTLLYSLCDYKLNGNEQVLAEGGEWDSTFDYLCFLGPGTVSVQLLPLASVTTNSARFINDGCATTTGMHRMQYKINTTAGYVCHNTINQSVYIYSNTYEIVE